MIKLKKNILVGKISFFLFFSFFLLYTITSNSQNSVLEGNYLEIKVLDLNLLSSLGINNPPSGAKPLSNILLKS